jgi:hypothetical protein
MATAKCGNSPVEYSDECSYICNCPAGKGCTWKVSCPNGKGGYNTISGTGHTTSPPPHPGMTVAGPLEGLASSLAELWKRPVTVPPSLRGEVIKRRTLEGSPEEIARRLSLELGPRAGRMS